MSWADCKADLTWQGYQIYDSDTIDNLISQCDNIELDALHLDASAGPFTVFARTASILPDPGAPPSHGEDVFRTQEFRLQDDAALLFHHYVTYIARNMMPYEHHRNPWQSFYPLMARSGFLMGQNSLLYAILAQAAGNLAHLGWKEKDMAILTIKYYTLAIESMRKELQQSQKDYSLILATVHTLIMAEAC